VTPCLNADNTKAVLGVLARDALDQSAHKPELRCAGRPAIRFRLTMQAISSPSFCRGISAADIAVSPPVDSRRSRRPKLAD
jgi:hypothetical protein